MTVKRTLRAFMLLAGLAFVSSRAQAIDCSNLPTEFTGNEFPHGNFFSNFQNSCYTIPLTKGYGGSGAMGDLDTVYYRLFLKADPRYQLIIVGAFPQARYFSITVNDEHLGVAQSILDVNIAPLNSHYINPFQPGAAFVGGQRYAVPVDFGGYPGKIQNGCKMDGFNVEVNKLDATLRHVGIDWNNDAGFFEKYPATPRHVVDTPEHTNPNKAGTVLIRSYLDVTPRDPKTSAYVIVRDVASGCGLPAAYVMNTLQVVATKPTVGNSWLDTAQINTHLNYQNSYRPQSCYAHDPQNQLVWLRSGEYVASPNPFSSYLLATIPAGLPANLAAAGRVMRMRFRIPETPPTPCTNGCYRSGEEEMRYMSLSFLGSATLATLADSVFTKDTDGYVTLIVSTGAAIPAWITPENGYTFLNLAAIDGWNQLERLLLRDIIPAGTFSCASDVVPYSTAEDTPEGGLMGEYLPVVDFPAAISLPPVAEPLAHPDSCAILPVGQPGVWPNCGIF